MTRTIAKMVAAGVFATMPFAAVSLPALAIADSAGAPIVLPAPLPADPPMTPEPPAPVQHGEYYNPNDSEDWYNYGADGGGGGGGGG